MKKTLFKNLIVQACIGLLAGLTQACSFNSEPVEMQKPVIYQVFTRLFGNDVNVNEHNGDKAVNGCGTMAAFTPKALEEIRKLGATHIWYTGIIEHATQTDYTAYGFAHDHRAIVKGKGYYYDQVSQINLKLETLEGVGYDAIKRQINKEMDYVIKEL